VQRLHGFRRSVESRGATHVVHLDDAGAGGARRGRRILHSKHTYRVSAGTDCRALCSRDRPGHFEQRRPTVSRCRSSSSRRRNVVRLDAGHILHEYPGGGSVSVGENVLGEGESSRVKQRSALRLELCKHRRNRRTSYGTYAAFARAQLTNHAS
jgi:hypothetical protein